MSIAVICVAAILALAPRWLEAYPDYSGYDLNCADVGHQVRVPGSDPHRLDGDRDGIGCESYISFGWMPWAAAALALGFGIWATREVS